MSVPRSRLHVEGVTRLISEPAKPKDKPFQRVDAALSAQAPLEEAEQEALIQDFEQMQLHAARQNRAIFGVGGGLLAAFFLWHAWAQYYHPWGQRITGELRGSGVDGDGMALALLVQALAMVACCMGLLQGIPSKGAPERGCLPASYRQRLLLGGSVASSLGCCLFWLWVHYVNLTKYGSKLGKRLDLLWIPLVPLTYTSVCCWVVASLAATGSQVAGLKQLRYACKTA